MRKFRKLLLATLLVLSVVASSIPVQSIIGTSEVVQAANIKLSKSSLNLYVGKSATLKVRGTKSKVKWSSSNKSVATVSSKGKVTAKKAGNTTIKAKVGKKTLKCKIAVKESSSLKGKNVKEALNTINNWYIREVWNNFVDFQSYRLTGLDCTGSKIDINFAYKNFKKSYKLKEEYDAYIACLGSNYSEIKDTWSLMKKQIEIIYDDLEENGVENDGSYLDLDLLSQYSDRFYNLVYEL